MSDIEEPPVSTVQALEPASSLILKDEKISQLPVMSGADRLMEKAVESGNIETIDRLLTLRAREEERQARLAYSRCFSAMQAEFVACKRDKKGYDYSYAPIETLQKAYGPIIAKHGFSYRWREETIETGKRCVMTISHAEGHSEENYFDIPALVGTKQMNAVQIAGAQSTYGRRYTFIAGFGVIIEDEDSDAATFADGVQYAENLNLITGSKTMDELKANSELVKKGLSGDARGLKLVADAFYKRRAELGKVAK